MNNENVFIIEDEAVVSEFLRTKLESLDYEVVGEAKRGEDALEYYDENDVDVMLVDIKLEGEIDGIETARQINENGDCVIIYVTAYSDSELLERAKETEPAGYLIKPIDEEVLESTMEIALYNRTLRKERNEALREKENLLREIRELIDRNTTIMSNLMELQTEGESTEQLDENAGEVLESLLEFKQKIEQAESDGTNDDND